MNQDELNERCIKLLKSPGVQNQLWHPRMFWEVGALDNPTASDLTRPKVDLSELEVMLATAANEESLCREDVNAQHPGRAEFIERHIRRGERPLLQQAG
ncbi:hypothetical protein [Thiohalospira sp.]|uniref:hypothetical protein n=1 Tax=Thiohalospira sp. TaxID=3080549 RepID=UPI00398148E0